MLPYINSILYILAYIIFKK